MRRRRSRLLSGFLLVAIVVFGSLDLVYVVTVPGYAPPWYGYGFLFGAWLLNWCGLYRLAATVTLAMFPLVIFSLVLTGSSAEPEATLSYLVLGILLASILLPWRGVAIFTFVSLAGLVAMPLLASETFPSFASIAGPISLTALGAALSLIFMYHRDQLERDRRGELQASEERLRLALAAARMGIWEWDVRTGAVKWSRRVAQLLGVETGSLGGTYEAFIEAVHPDDRARVQETIREALASQAADHDLLYRVLAPDGADRWLESSGRVERDQDDQPVRIRGTVRDVTDRQREDGEREALIQELEAKNAELERFTYTVSHDLKSPLVTIRGFLGYVARHATAGDHDLLEEDIGRIEAATERMQQLLDEVLRLSRIGRFANPPEELDLAHVADEAVALLQGRIEARAVQIHIAEDLPRVRGDRLRLVELLQNLVDNAIRFMGEQAEPRVRIGVRTDTSGPVYFVQDNGIGIEAASRERVFGLFDKLDPGTEGTGVGLALARRIVEAHGGRAWIESEGQGHGTTVCFTLPGPPPSSAER